MSGEESSDVPDPAADGRSDADPPSVPHGYELSDPHDAMSPPKEPCECWCMCCRRTFMSSEMWFQRVLNDPSGFNGFWMCPTPNCGGAGFNFEIFPTDPEHPANQEWVHFDDPDDPNDDDEFEEDEYLADVEATETDADWDPDETKWKELDEHFGGGDAADDEDLEGEEWKHGLQPGERPAEFDWTDETQFGELDDDERRYNEPDSRPREVDWSDREDRRGRKGPPPEYGGEWTEDDIPF
jgi:hypothetical protein